MKRYYLELYHEDIECENNYFAQSIWVGSLNEIKTLYQQWKSFIASNFDYHNFDSFDCCVMVADWKDDDYGDIEQYGVFRNGKLVVRK